jgi:hypothetical protein
VQLADLEGDLEDSVPGRQIRARLDRSPRGLDRRNHHDRIILANSGACDLPVADFAIFVRRERARKATRGLGKPPRKDTEDKHGIVKLLKILCNDHPIAAAGSGFRALRLDFLSHAIEAQEIAKAE